MDTRHLLLKKETTLMEKGFNEKIEQTIGEWADFYPTFVEKAIEWFNDEKNYKNSKYYREPVTTGADYELKLENDYNIVHHPGGSIFVGSYFSNEYHIYSNSIEFKHEVFSQIMSKEDLDKIMGKSTPIKLI